MQYYVNGIAMDQISRGDDYGSHTCDSRLEVL